MTPSVEDSKDWLRIDDPNAAKMLTDPQNAIYLSPFLAQENTVKGAATELNISELKMYRWVSKLINLGLLSFIKIERRRGKPIKHYRSIAKAFFVPFDLTPADTFEALLQQYDNHWQSRLLHGLDKSIKPSGIGMCLFRDAEGNLRTLFTKDPLDSTPDLVDDNLSRWAELKLSHQQALELKQKMIDLFNHYSHNDHSGGRSYILRMALAPII